jgi:excisionase family DNA binding protein
LTAREVAELLGVSTETVLRWTRRGDLPAIRLPGGAIRYRADSLEEWLSVRATSRNPVDTLIGAGDTAQQWGEGVTVRATEGHRPPHREGAT